MIGKNRSKVGRNGTREVEYLRWGTESRESEDAIVDVGGESGVRLEFLGRASVITKESTRTLSQHADADRALALIALEAPDRCVPRQDILMAAKLTGLLPMSEVLKALNRDYFTPHRVFRDCHTSEVGLDPSIVRVDVHEFCAALVVTGLEGDQSKRAAAGCSVLSMVFGPLLPGFLDDTIVAWRRKTLRLYLDALYRLAYDLTELDIVPEAIELWKALMRVAPKDEHLSYGLAAAHIRAQEYPLAQRVLHNLGLQLDGVTRQGLLPEFAAVLRKLGDPDGVIAAPLLSSPGSLRFDYDAQRGAVDEFQYHTIQTVLTRASSRIQNREAVELRPEAVSPINADTAPVLLEEAKQVVVEREDLGQHDAADVVPSRPFPETTAPSPGAVLVYRQWLEEFSKYVPQAKPGSASIGYPPSRVTIGQAAVLDLIRLRGESLDIDFPQVPGSAGTEWSVDHFTGLTSDERIILGQKAVQYHDELIAKNDTDKPKFAATRIASSLLDTPALHIHWYPTRFSIGRQFHFMLQDRGVVTDLWRRLAPMAGELCDDDVLLPNILCLHVVVLITMKDGSPGVLFCQRSSRPDEEHYYNGRWSTSIEEQAEPEDMASLKEWVARALREELGITDRNYTAVNTAVFLERDILNPTLLVAVKLPMSLREVYLKWQNASANNEHRQIVGLPLTRDTVIACIANQRLDSAERALCEKEDVQKFAVDKNRWNLHPTTTIRLATALWLATDHSST